VEDSVEGLDQEREGEEGGEDEEGEDEGGEDLGVDVVHGEARRETRNGYRSPSSVDSSRI